MKHMTYLEKFTIRAKNLFQVYPQANRVDWYSDGWVSARHKHPAHGTKFSAWINGGIETSKYDMRRGDGTGPQYLVFDAGKREVYRE